MRQAVPLFLVILSIGVFFLTYNFVAMIVHYGDSSPRKWTSRENPSHLLIDPVIEMPEHAKKPKNQRLLFHVALTATASPYSKWQCRIMYYYYKKTKDLSGSDMGKFTRILHSGNPDNLMDEIPTVVVDPLPEGLDRGYVVLNRPWAFVQWLDKDLLEKIAPTWMNVSLKMKNDPETDNTFGWVLEMYAYAVASALHGVQHILYRHFMLQPPWDLETGNKFILHYTYACDYNMKGELTYGKIGEWRFDKRSYLHEPPPRNLSLPPPGVPESVVSLVKMVNEATANIPNWDTAEKMKTNSS
ncbi:UNVERIFIED_CONTAM: Hydroxyproline O-arabinosyltransferase RDN2 [Sesamum latifolium]|uniref:Hydroxyproline O-arabinosyltransferase RDN2 n=1 Tax=Sesamum latifolium TaxID=2727402 RepID=A0AAW2YFQ1_9LAMI